MLSRYSGLPWLAHHCFVRYMFLTIDEMKSILLRPIRLNIFAVILPVYRLAQSRSTRCLFRLPTESRRVSNS